METITLIAQILPIVTACYLFLVILFHFYINIRRKFLYKVNCWFCNTWSKVPYEDVNCFYCINCEQYNGFTKDGDYNRIIPEQHDDLTNLYPNLKNISPPSNGLCAICNNNQWMKVVQLANFVPMVEKNYNAEIEHFQTQLEKAYKLCKKCDKVLEDKIQQQKAQLFGNQVKETHKMKGRKQSKRKMQIKKVPAWVKFCRISLTFFVFGILLFCATKDGTLYNYLQEDVRIILNDTANNLRFIELPTFSSQYFNSQRIDSYIFLCCLGIILQLILTIREKTFEQMNCVLCWSLLFAFKMTKFDKYSIYFEIPAIGYLLLNYFYFDNTKTLGPIKIKKGRCLKKEQPQHINNEYSDEELDNSFDTISSTAAPTKKCASSTPDKTTISPMIINQEINNSLSNLHLGGIASPKSRPSLLRPKPVLSPSKLSPNSWVAGGFWKPLNNDLNTSQDHQRTNLSRTSSESSGIGSQHTEYQFSPLSMNFDRHSCVSEPAYYFKPVKSPVSPHNMETPAAAAAATAAMYPNLQHNNMLLIQGSFSRVTTPNFNTCHWPDKFHNSSVPLFKDLNNSAWN